MSTLRVVFWRCLLAPTWPMVVAAAAIWMLARSTTNLRAQTDDLPALDGAATSWLSVPWTLVMFLVGAAAIECWPLFSTPRPGAALVLRLQRGPWAGCGAATAGALAAAAVWLSTLGLLLPMLLGGAPSATAFLEPTPVAGRTLDEHTSELVFLGSDERVQELRLRPIALLPLATPESTRLQLLVDGAVVPHQPIAIDNTGQLVRVPLDQPLPRLTLRRIGGNLPLLFPAGAVQAQSATTWPGWCNMLLAAWAQWIGLAVALALANLTATGAGLGVQLLLFGGALLVQAIAGLGPGTRALVAALRGRWLPAEPLFVEAISSLAAAGAAMIVAMLLRRGVRS